MTVSTTCSRRSPTAGGDGCSTPCAPRTARRSAALCTVLPAMTRFGVMKHLADARGGRAGGHPPPGPHQAALPQPGADPGDPRALDLPVRRIDRSPRWSACAAPSSRPPRPEPPEGASVAKPLHKYQTFIKAPAERVWEALLNPEFTKEYFHAQRFESSLEARRAVPHGGPVRRRVGRGHDRGDRPAAAARHHVAGALRHGDERGAAEPGRVGADRPRRRRHQGGHDPPRPRPQPADVGRCRRRVELGARLAQVVRRDRRRPAGVGGRRRSARRPTPRSSRPRRRDHRRHGIDANNSTWELLDGRELTPDEVDDVLGRAYAAAYHWRRASGRGPANAARASWLISHVHAVLGHGELALHHADRCAAVVAEAGLDDFDLAYAHEARARALACLGRRDEAATELAAGVGGPHRRRGGRQDPRAATSPPNPGTASPSRPPTPGTDFHKQNRASRSISRP